MKVVVIAAHPDDEVLGCGGTLLKHRNNNDEVFWIITTGMAEDNGFTAERIKTREEEIEAIRKAYGFKKVFSLGYPTMNLSSSTGNAMVGRISEIFQEIKPEVVYVMNRSDAHSDHRITFDAVFACTKSFRYPYIKKVLMYECISETEFAAPLPEKFFQPNYFVDITDFIEEKLETLKIYASEFGEHPFPRSLDNVKALAFFRGATAGVGYAEAFQLLKWIDK